MINPWTQGRVPGVPVFPPLGMMLSRYKLATPGHVPPQWVRLSLAGAHAYMYVFPTLALAAAQTMLTSLTITEDFWLCALLGDSTSALGSSMGTFRAQLNEDMTAYKYSMYAVDEANLVCNGKEPALLTNPSFIRANRPVNVKVQNLDGANPNTVQICMFGYTNWWRE